MKVYLAGGMKSNCVEMLRVMIAARGHDLLDPATWQDSDPDIYTERDLKAIRECDAVLAFMDSSNPSGYGMSLEIGYAHALGKRIVFLDWIYDDWRSRYFGMVRSVADVVCSREADALDLLSGPEVDRAAKEEV